MPLRVVVVVVDFLPVALEGGARNVYSHTESVRASKRERKRAPPNHHRWNKSVRHYLCFPVHFYTPPEILFEKWRAEPERERESERAGVVWAGGWAMTRVLGIEFSPARSLLQPESELEYK